MIMMLSSAGFLPFVLLFKKRVAFKDSFFFRKQVSLKVQSKSLISESDLD